jgi:hypothetical protein
MQSGDVPALGEVRLSHGLLRDEDLLSLTFRHDVEPLASLVGLVLVLTALVTWAARNKRVQRRSSAAALGEQLDEELRERSDG